MLPLIRQADLLFCSQADALRLFDYTGSMQAVAEKLLDLAKVPALVLSVGHEGVLG